MRYFGRDMDSAVDDIISREKNLKAEPEPEVEKEDDWPTEGTIWFVGIH